MKIEVWSDIACPWCYIGKHRLDTALSSFGHADEVEVVWRSYQLDPDAPRVSDMNLNDISSRKHGFPLEQAVARNDKMRQMGATSITHWQTRVVLAWRPAAAWASLTGYPNRPFRLIRPMKNTPPTSPVMTPIGMS